MSELEKSEPKTGKRMVSKGEYVQVQALLGTLNLSIAGLSIGLYICTVCCFGLLMWLTAGLYAYLICHQSTDMMLLFRAIFLFMLSMSGAYVFLSGRTAAKGSARKLRNVLPLTRANTGDLPALESLVRASAPPLQAQESVLLRAATKASETPVEQLVRPAGGQE